ncbi:MAG: 3-oxoacyl-ACP reductase FabG [Clostridiaceae bacterium]|nr:3-oxoacyl-ACP reductase FabG [Clostridiaceae bacterium]MBW4859189.1 3-oxoacyl-ACP reductase FabG [Clostridiaceae bacterium]MBW4868685.1 3-oxoacyl-ACP reductase FabG [Clostridiaceae bacterium]
MDLRISGKCAVVTGGSRGVGRGICLALAKEGVNVVINYNSSSKAALELKEEIEKLGGKAIAIKADLGNPEDCKRLIDEGEKAFGNVDILVNNAGIWPKNWVEDISLEEWNKTIDVNLTSVFLTSQAFVRKNIEKNKPGKILNVTSQAAFNGSTTGHAHYAASKAGVVSLTISMAREMAKHNININAIALGIVETDMTKKALEEKEDYYLNRIPVGRVATPKDIANIALFLVSEPSSYITGATIDATGGMLMR